MLAAIPFLVESLALAYRVFRALRMEKGKDKGACLTASSVRNCDEQYENAHVTSLFDVERTPPAQNRQQVMKTFKEQTDPNQQFDHSQIKLHGVRGVRKVWTASSSNSAGMQYTRFRHTSVHFISLVIFWELRVKISRQVFRLVPHPICFGRLQKFLDTIFTIL